MLPTCVVPIYIINGDRLSLDCLSPDVCKFPHVGRMDILVRLFSAETVAIAKTDLVQKPWLAQNSSSKHFQQLK